MVETSGKQKKQKKKRAIANTLTIIDSIARRSFRRSDRKGFAAEDVALKQGEYFRKKKLIKAVRLSERFSSDDMAGRDLVVELLNGKIIYISVTAAYYRSDEIDAQKQGNFYLPVYPWQDERIVRKKFQTIILEGYFSDLEMSKLRKMLDNIGGPEKEPNRLRKFWRSL